MKTFLPLLFLIVCTASYCQENSVFMTDSLLTVLKVKTRTKTIESKTVFSYIVDHYNESGQLILTVTHNPQNDSPMTRTNFYYNNRGLLDSSIMVKCGQYQSAFLIPNMYNKSIEALKTYYQYDQNNRLEKTITKDDHNRLNYETLYTQDPYSYNILFYSLTGYVFKVVEYKFEHGKVPIGMIESELDENGRVFNQVKQKITNSYHSNGQLEESKFEGPNCNSSRKYVYYKNGLLKSKKKDNCYLNWSFSYTYY